MDENGKKNAGKAILAALANKMGGVDSEESNPQTELGMDILSAIKDGDVDALVSSLASFVESCVEPPAQDEES
jgi:hypothetical protein